MLFSGIVLSCVGWRFREQPPSCHIPLPFLLCSLLLRRPTFVHSFHLLMSLMYSWLMSRWSIMDWCALHIRTSLMSLYLTNHAVHSYTHMFAPVVLLREHILMDCWRANVLRADTISDVLPWETLRVIRLNNHSFIHLIRRLCENTQTPLVLVITHISHCSSC